MKVTALPIHIQNFVLVVIIEGDKEKRVHDGEDHGREQGASQDKLEPGVRDGVLGLAPEDQMT